jgi:hypothetical protein
MRRHQSRSASVEPDAAQQSSARRSPSIIACAAAAACAQHLSLTRLPRHTHTNPLPACVPVGRLALQSQSPELSYTRRTYLLPASREPWYLTGANRQIGRRLRSRPFLTVLLLDIEGACHPHRNPTLTSPPCPPVLAGQTPFVVIYHSVVGLSPSEHSLR